MTSLDETIKEYKDFLKSLIKEHEKKLNDKNFEVIYNKHLSDSLRPVFTALLFKNNINPLEYMNEVPKYFAYDLNIEEFTIPNNIVEINPEAFAFCENLKWIAIPSNVTNIDNSAFWRCDNLKDVYYEGSEEDWKNIKIAWDNKALLKATIHYNS